MQLERKEDGYRDSHEAGVFVSDGGISASEREFPAQTKAAVVRV